MPEVVEVALPTLEEATASRERTREVIVRTPLVPLHNYQGERRLLLKPEIHQAVTSFKLRGFYNAVASMTDEERARGISTVSAGNAAQGLAWCGRHFGIAARTLMPDHAPQPKIDAVRAYGCETVLVPVAEVFDYLQNHGWESEPYSFVHPWFHRGIVTGYGSIAYEIIEDCPEVEAVYVPVGGGALMTGVGAILKQLKPDIKMIGVEPTGCPSLHASLDADRPMSVEAHTICDGVHVPYITEELFPLLRSIVDEMVLVDDDDVIAMIRRLALGNKIIAEPSGALAAAGAVPRLDRHDGPCVALVTGGSIDATKLTEYLAGG